MKLKDQTQNITLTESECNFLVNVLLDWENAQKNMSKQERQMWESLLTQIDPYLQK